MAPALGLPFASVAAEGAAGRRVVEVSAAWPVGVMDRADAVPLCERPVPGLRGCLSLGPSRPGPGRGDPAASSQKGLGRGSIRQERARVPGRPREVSGQCLGRGWRSLSSSGGVALGLCSPPSPAPHVRVTQAGGSLQGPPNPCTRVGPLQLGQKAAPSTPAEPGGAHVRDEPVPGCPHAHPARPPGRTLASMSLLKEFIVPELKSLTAI